MNIYFEQYLLVEYIYWYWIYHANPWGMSVSWRVSVCPSGTGLGEYRVFLEDRERGKRCVMLKQAKVGSKKLRDLSCVDKPLPGGAQGYALLQLRCVLETRLCQGRGQGLEVGDKHVMEDLS